MVDFKKSIPYYLAELESEDTALRYAEEQLGRTPCLSSRPSEKTVMPAESALRLLTERW